MRIQLLNKDGARFIGFAKRKLAWLQGQRRDLNIPMLRKWFYIANAQIFVQTSEFSDLIRIVTTGAGIAPQILLTNYLTSSAYHYTTDQLSISPNPSNALAGDLVPIYNGRNQVQEYNELTYTSEWSASEIGEVAYEYLGGLNAYEMAIFWDQSFGVYGRVGNDFGVVATYPDTPLPQFAGAFGDLFGLPAYKSESAWNLYRGAILYTLNPANKNIQDSWYWTPSFFTAQQADPNALQPGFYYGKYPFSNYMSTEEGAQTFLDSLKVSLKATLDTRYTSALGAYQYGWAEIVTEVDGEDVADLHLYLQSDPLTVPGNATFGYFRIIGTVEDMTITAGADLQGFDAGLIISLDDADADVELWNFNIWTAPEGDFSAPDQDTGVCISIVSGSSAKFYRFSGYNTLVYETSTYHSHSTSNDGSILAVFDTTTGGLITKVSVFDLYGDKDPAKGTRYPNTAYATGAAIVEGDYVYTAAEGTTGSEPVTWPLIVGDTVLDGTVVWTNARLLEKGGFTELRVSETVASVEALTGCVIPYRETGFAPSSLSFDLATSDEGQDTPSDYTDFLSSLSMVTFFKRGTTPPVIRKVTCDNGVDAEYAISVDACFDSTFILEDPDLGVNEERLVGWWDEGGIFKGVVRGDFTGTAPGIKFVGTGTPWIPVITRPDEFAIDQDGNPSGTIGEVSVLGPNDAPEQDCDEQTYDKYTGTTSCGQTGVFEDTVDPIASGPSLTPPSPYWGKLVSAGELITVTGGKQPYTVTVTNGASVTKNSETEWEFGSMPSCTASEQDASSTITVTDACGKKTTMDVLLNIPSAEWCCDDPIIGVSCDSNAGQIRINCFADESGYTYTGSDCSTRNGYFYMNGAVAVVENIRCVYAPSGCEESPLNGSNPCSASCGGTDSCTLSRWYGYWRCP